MMTEQTTPTLPIKALLIDFDGTMVMSIHLLYQTYDSFLRHYGCEGSVEEFKKLNGPFIEEIIFYLKEKYHLPDELECMNKLYKEQLMEGYLTDVKPFPFMEETLQLAKAKKLSLVVVTSNQLPLVEACLRKLSLLHYFESIVCMETGCRSKPAPDLYLKALDFLGITDKEAITIEDSENGIAASIAAGVYTLYLTEEDSSHFNFPPNKSKPVTSWYEIHQFLEGIHPNAGLSDIAN